ncbi:MAG: zinc-dependent metalloprotease [Ilumatobacteraceae bacterium]|jgi:putative hydrolase|nr:zinc-dependent metalloprotease [Ilumatobacteraceae bacterium]
MSDDAEPAGTPDPFAGLPMFGDLAKALSGQGPLNWDAARQFAQLAATGGQHEPNVDPALRLQYGELGRIAALHVADVTGYDGAFPEITTVTRGQWAQSTLEAYRPLFTELATSLGGPTGDPAPEATDPLTQMMAGLNRMMAPAMLGMAVGSMVGQLAQRAFGEHDLPIPRDRHGVAIVARNVDQVASASGLPLDQLRLWVLAHELAGHVAFAGPHLRDPLASLVRRHVGAFSPDPQAVMDKLAGLDVTADDPMAALSQAFGDPEVLLGAVRSPEQLALEPQLDAAVATVVGYTDWVVDAVAVRIIGGDALRVAEVVRERRVEASPDDVFVERLLGIRLGPDQVARGKAFVQGVVDRGGEPALQLLTSTPGGLPTPAEVDAPGLWLARVTGG